LPAGRGADPFGRAFGLDAGEEFDAGQACAIGDAGLVLGLLNPGNGNA